MNGPLSGVTVIEMAGLGPVPFAGMILADAGARVIRVQGRKTEPVSGSVDSTQDPLSRGRVNVGLDLKKPGGVQALLRLLDSADALLEGYRPGVMERLGVGPDVCLARKPSLVYGRMTGWGQSGPLAHTAGHDINYIAISGALHAIGTTEAPVPPLNLVGDFGGGGALLAFGVASALLHAARTGHGQVIDTAMSDGAAYLMAPFYARLAGGSWRDARESNVLDGGAPHYGVYRCADGKFIAAGPLEPQFWADFLRRIGLEDDPGMAGRGDPAQWPHLRERLRAHFASRTRDAWCAELAGTDACVAPVLSMQEAINHPHNVARGTFIDTHGAMVPAPMPRFSLSDNRAPPPQTQAAAATDDVLLAAGFSREEVTALREHAVLA
jgi:alpha-methylacyl-CoA racemase